MILYSFTKRRLTETEYLAFEREAQTKSEFYDGEMFAMAGARRNHNLIAGNILKQLHISIVKKNGFIDYMKSIGKLGGQNKVPRLSNDRIIADGLKDWVAIYLPI